MTLLLLLLLLLCNIYSGLLVIRWRSSNKFRTQQKTSAVSPSTYKCCMLCPFLWPSVWLWPTGDLGATDGSDL